jgi:putative transposase
VKKQCFLLGIARSTAYYEPLEKAEDGKLLNAMDEIYTACPFYGKRKMKAELIRKGFSIGIKKVCSLMRKLGLCCIYRKPKTSVPNPQHKKYPYLLKNVAITKNNHVWGTDITFIRLVRGWAYLTAVLDWYSRYVLAFRLSITMEKEFCIDALREALGAAKPEIFNTDQGSQFTSYEFTGLLEENGIKISMDGRGRCLDNIFTERLWRTVKYEEVYLKSYSTMEEAQESLKAYFHFYNHSRPHQSLNYKTPAQIYFNS